jgi:hypothetical protein
VFENKVLRRIYWTEGGELRGWRKLLNEELHNLCSSPSIVKMIKSRGMRWAGHVARIGRRGMHIGILCKCQKERDHQGDEAVGGWVILK